MKTIKFFISALAATAMAASMISCQKDNGTDDDDPVEDIVFEDGATLNGRYNDNITLKSGNYTLSSSLQITAPGVLTIEPGTTITAAANDNIIYILIEQGAKIMAQGTSSAPITMTSETKESGAWGGLHICGYAPTNAGSGSSEIGNASYGGNNSSDNSGVLEYLVIENSGYALDSEHEANGISLYGVGNGTTISNIYVVDGKDDGIEFFGGSVNIDHCIVENCGDDSYDWTEGWNGTADHIVAYQSLASCDCLMECDNNGSNVDATPNSHPTISHATFIGKDAQLATGGINEEKTYGIKFRAGTYVNMEYAIVTGKTTAISLETQHTVDSFAGSNPESSITNTRISGAFKSEFESTYGSTQFAAAETGNALEQDFTNAFENNFVGMVDGCGAVDKENDWTTWTRQL